MIKNVLVGLAISSLLACGDDGGKTVMPDAPGADAPIPAPTITSFTASMSLVPRNGPVMLTAVFENGTGTIDQGVGAVTSGTAVASGNLALDTTFKLTVTGGDGTQVTAMASVNVERDLWIADFDASAVLRFHAPQDGDVAPAARLVGANTGFGAPSGVMIDGTTLFVADQGQNKIFVFDNAYTLDGNVTPTRTIGGTTTTLDRPRQMQKIGNELYVGQDNAILVFPIGASGDVAPTRSITLTGNVCDLKLYDNLLYVAADTAEILVLDPADTGPADPVRTITGANTTLNQVDGLVILGNELWVSEDGLNPDQITIFDKTANGDVAPLRTIAGTNTLISYAARLGTWNNQVYMADINAGAVSVFDSTATGDMAPTRRITGTATLLSGPWALWLDPP